MAEQPFGFVQQALLDAVKLGNKTAFDAAEIAINGSSTLEEAKVLLAFARKKIEGKT